MWKPIITSSSEYKQIRDIVDGIYLNISNRFFTRKGFSVYFEAGGLCLFLAYYKKIYGDGRTIVNSNSLRGIVEFLLDNSCSYQPKDITDLTRYAELGTLIAYLYNEQLIEGDVEYVCKNLDDILIKVIPDLVRIKSLDLMGGIVSIGLYYYQRYQSNPMKFSKLLANIVDVLYDNAMKENGMVMWTSIIEVGSKSIGFNFGIAHGIPGIILFLRMVYDIKISTRKSKELIKGAVQFLISQMHSSTNHVSVFYDICDLKYNGEDSRLSWCYGDLGIAYTFILLSRTKGLECLELEDTALNILRSTVKRVTLEQSRVRDAGLCHGCFGIAHMYNRLFQMTGECFLLEASLHWYKEGLKMSNNTSLDYEGFWLPYFFKDDCQEVVDDYNLSFQTGISGVGLALISCIEAGNPSWDRFLLLS